MTTRKLVRRYGHVRCTLPIFDAKRERFFPHLELKQRGPRQIYFVQMEPLMMEFLSIVRQEGQVFYNPDNEDFNNNREKIGVMHQIRNLLIQRMPQATEFTGK